MAWQRVAQVHRTRGTETLALAFAAVQIGLGIDICAVALWRAATARLPPSYIATWRGDVWRGGLRSGHSQLCLTQEAVRYAVETARLGGGVCRRGTQYF